MRNTSLTIAAVCATLLWVETVQSSPQRFPATGQTTVYTAAGVDDGAIRAGAALSYKDNGDGTITDNNTKLMWEKKSSGDGSLHDWNNQYPWTGLCQQGGACSTNADCGEEACIATDGQGTGYTIFQWVAQLNATRFAGHRDWRIPNVKELQSIVDFQNFGPAVATAFNTSCTATCTVTECSCTQDFYYWASTTYILFPDQAGAWFVDFINGFVLYQPKPEESYVRGVRGGFVPRDGGRNDQAE